MNTDAIDDGAKRYGFGIDFGTTFTGVCFISSSKTSIKDVIIVKEWPGEGEQTESKTPSRIAYHRVDDGLELCDWGFGVDAEMEEIVGLFKLHLDKATKLAEFDDPSLAELGQDTTRLPEGKTAVEVIEDYLTQVLRWAEQVFRKTVLGSWSILDNWPLDVCITVPATWSDKAKDATLQAARKSMFKSKSGCSVRLITEPEAAAITVLSELSEDDCDFNLAAGDAFAIVDCGGGTIDIIIYQVISTQPPQFKEVVTGEGGKYGSTAIDRAFLRMLSKRFGSKFDDLPASEKGPGSWLLQDFESHKRGFGRNLGAWRNSRPYTARLHMSVKTSKGLGYDKERGIVTFSRQDMDSFFEPCITEILNLVQSQLNRANAVLSTGRVETLILVGGFAQSHHLATKVQDFCKEEGGISFIVAKDPSIAIAKGAAFSRLSGIQPSVRCCRRHYGICFDWKFEERVDPESRRLPAPWKNGLGDLCSNRIVWSINKGDPTTQASALVVNTSKIYTPSDPEDSLEFSLDLYASESDTPPRYMEDDDVTHVGQMWMNFSNEDVEGTCTPQRIPELQPTRSGRLKSKSVWSYLLEYVIEIFVAHEDGNLHFRARTGANTLEDGTVDGGRVVGHGTVDFSTF